MLLAAIGLLIAGCGRAGPPIAPVSGTVRMNGKPLTEGNVCFASAEGFAASAPVKPDGTFRLGSQYGKGIPLGTYRVTVVPPAPEGPVPMIPTAATAKQRPSMIPSKVSKRPKQRFDGSGQGRQPRVQLRSEKRGTLVSSKAAFEMS